MSGCISKRVVILFPFLMVGILFVLQGLKQESTAMSAREKKVGGPYSPPAEVIPTSPEWMKPLNIGAPVNTTGWEDSVSISPDGKMLYFSYSNYDFLTFLATHGRSRNITGPERGLNVQDMADIMVSSNEGDSWSVPRFLNHVSIPFALDDGAFTPDGRFLFHSGLRNSNIGGPGSSDIYVSKRADGEWSKPINLGPPVCTKASESNPWISSNGELLLFDSDRPNGKGDRDIWQSKKVGGRWQQPVNLGAPVNTEREEVQPFLTRDGKTLFFAGASRDGKGDHVIYCCHRTASGGWTKPEVIISNLVGEPTLTADGRRLYFVHIYRMPDKTYTADIMFTERKH